MKPHARLTLVGRRISTVGLAALLSCLVLTGSTNALANATTSTSLTQAQKLSKALKACKKLPKSKRAACVKKAKKKYATHPVVNIVKPLTGSVTPPTAPTPPPAGPVAPAGPTFEEIQRIKCFFYYSCDATHPMLNLMILERGVPRLGTGVSHQRGGDDVPSDTWIFPLLLSYDEPVQRGQYVQKEPPFGPLEWVTETEHYFTRERANALLDNKGTWTLWFQASSTTCEPVLPTYCNTSVGGGA
jgi:hypothetical protein